jgi:outer membrane protein OmpA-like peptidoglycan-associated protein
VNPCSSLGIGLAGFGTVGSGVWNTLQRNGKLIADRTGGGVTLHIAKILLRDLTKTRATTGEVPAEILTTDWQALVADPAVDIVVELIGGTTDASEIVSAALRAKKPVVTGNKALLAERGRELFALSRKMDTPIHFEAAVAGGIPIIRTLQDSFIGNRIHSFSGIINGTLDGMVSLDSLLNLPPNILVGRKTMLPSDLLFDFNKSDLRESAKVGMMKLCLLIDQNPALYCWIEGHTDLVGGDEFNLNLSIKRAEAVRNYLVHSLKVDGTRIITRGFGRYEPIVTTGNAQQQSANRRVEIRMRKTPPTKEQMTVAPPKAVVTEEAPTPKAVLVKPLRALPIEGVPPESKAPPKAPPRAAPVEETPPLRAAPIFEEIPSAEPVEEESTNPNPESEPPRAQAIEDE